MNGLQGLEQPWIRRERLVLGLQVDGLYFNKKIKKGDGLDFSSQKYQ